MHAAPDIAQSDNNKWWTLIAVSIAIFMLLLDITVVNVALPDIQRDLDASFTDLQWVVDAYSLTLAATLLAVGSLADLLGRRLVFVIGLGVFTTASLALRTRRSIPTVLNLARAVAGHRRRDDVRDLAGADRAGVPGPERGTAFGVWGATIGGAVAIGPLVGGVITDGIGWEWIFFVNVPIGIAAIVADAAQGRRVAATRTATGSTGPASSPSRLALPARASA